MNQNHRYSSVLMAEDDPDDQLIAADAFRDRLPKHPLHFVQDGEELLDYLMRRGQFDDPVAFPMPALVLLDLNMPRMDGREAIREIKQCAQLKQIPVVVLSTSSADADIAGSYRDGVNSYICKPNSFSGMLDIVETLGHYWLETVNLPRPQ